MVNRKYTIKEKLGAGRSTVFLCDDIDFADKKFAIKVLSPTDDQSELDSFSSEFFTLKKLNHPNILQVNEIGTVVLVENDSDIKVGSKYFTQEYFEGVELLKYSRLNDEEKLKEILTQLCSVLFYLHQSNYIYYDLKPENILISEVGGSPVLKLIDFGFTTNIYEGISDEVKGSAQYIAPELLKKEKHDHRIDLYSLGIILYQIIYKKFPFPTENELQIYKSHLEDDFEFPQNSFSPELNEALKKLLIKEPDKRYSNSLQILLDLGIDVNETVSKYLIPAKVFSNRKDSFNILRAYTSDETSSEVFSIKGSEGSGKTTLVYEIFSKFENVVLIRNDRSKTGFSFLRKLLRKIIFTPFIFNSLDEVTISSGIKILDEKSTEYLDDLKFIFSSISAQHQFVLILEDFNMYDDFTIEIMKDIIPIFQVNKIKVMLSENSDIPYASGFIHNMREVNLTPFTDAHLSEMIDLSFYNNFPKEELKKMILLYADLLPGNISDFIRDILMLKLLRYNYDGVEFIDDEAKINILKSSHDAIYNLRFDNLNEKEKNLSKFISVFDINLEQLALSKIAEIDFTELSYLIETLQQKNILHKTSTGSTLSFTSDGLKKFVYTTIENKKEFHLKIAHKIEEVFNSPNRVELARHYEQSKKYEKSYDIILDEISNAESVFAFAYIKKLYHHLHSLPLAAKYKLEINFQLCKVMFRLNEYKAALTLIETVLKLDPPDQMKMDLELMKGSSLIELGDLEEGKSLLNNLLEKIEDEKAKTKLLVEIAGADLDLQKFDDAEILCDEIIKNSQANFENIGKCYSIKGMINIYRDNNLDAALENYLKAEGLYKDANIKIRVAQMEMNIGNIYSMKEEYEQAEKYWNDSLEINKSIGNLDNEGKFLLSLGAYYLDRFENEKAFESFERGERIFQSIGNQEGEGLILANLGELYLFNCEFEKSFEALLRARKIFQKHKNLAEELEIIFILGKFYSFLGDNEMLDSVINDMASLIVQEGITDKHHKQYSYLVQLSKFYKNEYEGIADTLIFLRKSFGENGDNYLYYRSTIFLILVYFKTGKYAEASEEFNGNKIKELAEKKAVFSAELLYLKSFLAKRDTEGSPINFLEESLNIVKELNINELTWKILLAIAEINFSRGIYNKANEYATYAKEIILYFADNIKSSAVRNIYYNKPERKSALEKIESFQSQFVDE